MGIDILEFGIERTKPFFRSCVCLKRAHHVGLAAGGREALRLNLVPLVTLEQRIALKFLVDENLKLDIRHLQQLDRLLQLRRHDERLALAEFEPLVQRHGALSWFTG